MPFKLSQIKLSQTIADVDARSRIERIAKDFIDNEYILTEDYEFMVKHQDLAFVTLLETVRRHRDAAVQADYWEATARDVLEERRKQHNDLESFKRVLVGLQRRRETIAAVMEPLRDLADHGATCGHMAAEAAALANALEDFLEEEG